MDHYFSFLPHKNVRDISPPFHYVASLEFLAVSSPELTPDDGWKIFLYEFSPHPGGTKQALSEEHFKR